MTDMSGRKTPIATALAAVSRGTEVTVRCENTPSGIWPSDRQKGMASTLKIAAFAQ
ncbi:hypothetical protein [Mesorhizobium sp.]|uniref:hypothetical protein n=1 Tax=Mesorhizobium sp. TaxID=1871066 RepID=UPI0025C41366|nr:hypothetical protein [Mesorhizobium sp.]